MSAKLTNSLLGRYVQLEKIAREYRVVPAYRYNSTLGVGAGWRDLNQHRTSFAGVDSSDLSTLDPPDKIKAYYSFPFIQTSVAIAHYVPECLPPNVLRISLVNLVNIFAGNITRWNDPSLVSDSKCLATINRPINVLYRTPRNSATYALTKVLSAIRPDLGNASFSWPYKATTHPYPYFLPSNDAMLFRVRVSNYSIGYLPWSVRDRYYSVGYASISTPGNSTIVMNRSTVQTAGQFSDENPTYSYPNCSSCWPFLVTSYFALPTQRIVSKSINLNTSHPSSCINIADAARFLRWTYSIDAGLEEYAPISPSARAKALQELEQISCNGNLVLSTSYVWLVRFQALKFSFFVGYAVASGIVSIGLLLIVYNERLHTRDIRMLKAMMGEDSDSIDAHLLHGLVSSEADEDLPLIIPSDDQEVILADSDLPQVSPPTMPQQASGNGAELISISEVAIGRLIGSGSFGEVFKATYNRSTVAVKRIALLQDPEVLSTFIKEARSMQLLQHPNVLTLIGFGIQSPYCYLISEYCKHKSLDVYMKRNTGIITFRTRLDWMIDVARGMAFIHSKSVIHRDLKLSNLLLDAEMRVKIGDLGTSATGLLAHRTRVGTLDHCAPEILDGKPYDRSCDVYSFAICLWSLFSRMPLYLNYTMFDIITRVTSGQRPSLDPIPSPSLASLIQECWNQDPALRPSFNQIVTRLEVMDESDFQSFA